MQTKKKGHGRNAAREIVSPKVLRSQRKYNETIQVVEKNVTERLISSARKRTVGNSLTGVFLFMGWWKPIYV